MSKQIQVALVGNPNTGKTSLFNELTGLSQKVGNYPGVTVDRKQGTCALGNKSAVITDLPGTYSVNPTSLDESIVLSSLMGINDRPDVVVVVADIENLKRNLLLFSQIQDLKIPMILALNMADQMERKGITINLEVLEKELHTKVVLISTKKKQGIKELKEAITKFEDLKLFSNFNILTAKIDADYFSKLQRTNPQKPIYELWIQTTKPFLNGDEAAKNSDYDVATLKKYQHKETIYRYQKINKILKESYSIDVSKATDLRSKLDKIVTHKVFGYVIFFGLLLLIFQSIFDWASAPMDFIDALFANMSNFISSKLPEGKFTDLLVDGVIPGIGGVVIFIPQIAILFLFIAILEETGYMSRVVFLMDKIMRRFGMGGKSIIPLISGTACAIPAIMATRTISSAKERLITVLVTPFIACSARLPVYSILIQIIIPDTKIAGFLGLQGLTFFWLYILGFAVAILAAYILHKTLKTKNNSFFVIEMPNYKMPSIKNVFYDVFEKTKAFVFDAGKIIVAISILLWFLASHGPSSYINAEKNVLEKVANQQLPQEDVDRKIAATKIENSYIGIIGKTIEPAVKPLGYDWKIGIGLITSFAAREVFVGTLATIYSIEDNEEDRTALREKMEAEINEETGEKRFNFATGVSLLLFYAFAMQCVATLAIVKRETKSWKWPLVQLIGMGILAYISAFISYQILS